MFLFQQYAGTSDSKFKDIYTNVYLPRKRTDSVNTKAPETPNSTDIQSHERDDESEQSNSAKDDQLDGVLFL
jgi:hypothetical protein